MPRRKENLPLSAPVFNLDSLSPREKAALYEQSVEEAEAQRLHKEQRRLVARSAIDNSHYFHEAEERARAAA